MAAAQSAVLTLRPQSGRDERRNVELTFTGEKTQKVDSKGRMSVPPEFRRVLEAGDPEWSSGKPMQCQIIYGDHLKGRVQVYTAQEFANVVARIQAMPDSDPNKDSIIHIMVTQSEPMTVDKDGRAVLALKHREKLGITEGGLSFRGRITHFELWRDDTYVEKVKAPVEAFLADKSENFNPLSLVNP